MEETFSAVLERNLKSCKDLEGLEDFDNETEAHHNTRGSRT
jgi:hypothetical protein